MLDAMSTAGVGKTSTTGRPAPGCARQPPDSGVDDAHLVRVLGVGELFPVTGGTQQERVAAIASRQRGRVARRQLVAAGVSGKQIDRMVASGHLIKLHRGVYAVGYLAEVALARETAALLACDGSVLSHRSAARVWELLPEAPDRPIELTVTQPRRSREDIIVHRSSKLTRLDRRVRDLLPLTSPARTILDLAAALTTRETERALDEALTLRLVTIAEIRAALGRYAGHHGTGALAALLDHRLLPGLTRSRAEALFLEIVRAAGLPEPETGLRSCGYQIDFLWRRERVVFEIDGYPYHSTKTAFERDRRKDAALKQAGLDANRVSAQQVQRESLAVAAYVAARLALARA